MSGFPVKLLDSSAQFSGRSFALELSPGSSQNVASGLEAVQSSASSGAVVIDSIEQKPDGSTRIYISLTRPMRAADLIGVLAVSVPVLRLSTGWKLYAILPWVYPAILVAVFVGVVALTTYAVRK
jgi:hypothetical protein